MQLLHRLVSWPSNLCALVYLALLGQVFLGTISPRIIRRVSEYIWTKSRRARAIYTRPFLTDDVKARWHERALPSCR